MTVPMERTLKLKSEKVIKVDESSFEREVLEASKTAPVLVDCWAEWCAPCRMLAPTMETLADTVKVCSIDVEANQALALSLTVSAIPTVVLYKGGKEVERWVGIRPAKDYMDAVATAAPVKA